MQLAKITQIRIKSVFFATNTILNERKKYYPVNDCKLTMSYDKARPNNKSMFTQVDLS